ncbi:MAG: endonuclease/exonuclease/phosphatase family protein [Flavobacteriales bacterium]|nr:endonuclease/exonuclease/phosphatase family protein [Flavobacteriales bacterium]
MSEVGIRVRGWFDRFAFVLNIILLIALSLSYLAGIVSPEKFWPLALVGMSYPILLAITVGFIIYWILKRRWFLFLNIAFLLIKWDYVQATIQFNPPSKTETEEGFKVMSFNVRLFDRFNWIKDTDTELSIYRFLFSQQPEILCIQEFFHSDKQRFPRMDTLLNMESVKYVHFENHPNTKWKSFTGMATFSKYPIVNKGVVYFDKTHNNMGIFTDVLIGSDTTRIYNIHLQSIGLSDKDYAILNRIMEQQELEDTDGGKQVIRQMREGFQRRSSQAEKVAAHIQSCHYPIIVCGDFNEVPTSYSYQTIRKGLTDSFSKSGRGLGATYVRIPFFRIDNILFSSEFGSSEHIVHHQILSDHFAVSAQLKID